jgi:hypothetical protein
MTEVMTLDDAHDRESFAVAKFFSLVQNQETDSEEKSTDAKFRQAARSWRQIFHIPEAERLVSFYSCCYDRKLSNQGWMYISVSHLYFYSFVLGTETKVIIEYKDIKQLDKDKSRSGVFPDSIKIVTKNQTEHFFSNLFHRDETYELIEHLTNLALERLLKTTTTDPAPGLVTGTGDDLEANGDSSTGNTRLSDTAKPLKASLETQKKNKEFQNLFSLPTTESILKEIDAMVTISNGKASAQGRLFLSNSFLCFLSYERYQCFMALPFFAIMRVERINTAYASVSITARHQLKLFFQFSADRTTSDLFCNTLRERLQEHVGLMKRVKPFLASCASEELVAGKEVAVGGLGVKYGYVESKKYVPCCFRVLRETD